MNVDAIREYIRLEILQDPAAEIAPDQDLLLSELLDSLSVVRLVGHIEAETGLVVPAEDVTLESFGTLEAIAAYVAGRTGTPPSP